MPFNIIKSLVLIVLVFTFTGCSKNNSHNENTSQITDDSRVITDMAGREVTIPKKVNKLYSMGQPGVVAVYTINPDKLLGWCLKFSQEESKYINSKYLSLPVLGLMQGGNNTANKEEIMGRNPDIILLMTTPNEAAVTSANETEELLGIPVVIADFTLENLGQSYRFLGDILNEEDRANYLAEYIDNVIEQAKENTTKIKPNEVLNVYYAQGSKGLQTAPKSSSHSEVINLVGGNNVVELNADSNGRLGINMEQLLVWNPDVIIASYSMGHSFGGNAPTEEQKSIFSIIINGSTEWQLLDAVKNNKVYMTPSLPYNWLDMPPSVNRIIGIKWLGNVLYPQYYDYDIKRETREFYSIFYNYQLTDEEIDEILLYAK